MDIFPLLRPFTYISIVLLVCLTQYSCDNENSVAEPSIIIVPVDSLLGTSPSAVLNPTGRTPLAALLGLSCQNPLQLTVEVQGDVPLSATFDGFRTVFNVPILGLYPDLLNEVHLTLMTQDSVFAFDTLYIQTEPANPEWPDINVLVSDPDRMEPGLTCSSVLPNQKISSSHPVMFDHTGQIRWSLDPSPEIMYTFRIEDGVLYGRFGSGEIVAYDMLGRKLRELNAFLPTYFPHHDFFVMPNGHYLVPVDKKETTVLDDRGRTTFTSGDHMIEIDTAGTVLQEWDFRAVLDVDRYDQKQDRSDWLHGNSIWYVESEDAIIFSGRNQGIFQVDRNNNLDWILAAHKGWEKAGANGDGFDTKEYLLTALDAAGNPYPEPIQQGDSVIAEFGWPFGQHVPIIFPDGRLLVFDNGLDRDFGQSPLFSRGVAYEIDPVNMTVKQTWEYGSILGQDFYAGIISNVQWLPETGHCLIAPGLIELPNSVTARTTEVNYPGTEVVFDAIVELSHYGGDGTLNWGERDMVYRSFRLPLYPPSVLAE